MKDRRSILDALLDGADLPGEPIPGIPVVEISGECRVLIEHHRGVTMYSRERICVKVKFGQIAVCGCGLELMRMTKEQLVISGRIDSVSLLRRGK